MCEGRYEVFKIANSIIEQLKGQLLYEEIRLLELNNFFLDVDFNFKHNNKLELFRHDIFDYEYKFHAKEGAFTFLELVDLDDYLIEYITVIFNVIFGNDKDDMIVEIVNIYSA